MKLYIDYDRFEEQFEVVTEENKTNTTSELECNKKEYKFITKTIADYVKAREMICNISERTQRIKRKKELQEYLKANPEEAQKRKEKNKKIKKTLKILGKVLEKAKKEKKNVIGINNLIVDIIRNSNYEDETILKELKKYLKEKPKEE